MGKYFGTDGFRGEAGKNLTAEHAYKVGRFLGWYYGEKRRRLGDTAPPKVVIGKDTRRSGYMLEYALSAGLTASGADAYLLHVTTTPSVSYAVRTEGFDCGVMISASHNPYYDNGIKLLGKNGEKMDDGTIALLEEYLDGNLKALGKNLVALPWAEREKIGRTVDYVAGRNRYVGYLISLGTRSFKGKKVGLDCANGAAWSIAKWVFDALGAETYLLGADPNGLNINLGVGSTHIDNLQKFVLEKGLDVGFAYDGDADRCICVDEKGGVFDGDKILYVCAKYLKEKGELTGDKVVTTVMSGYGLYEALDSQNIAYEKTPVGDKYVYEKMVQTGAALGGEQSGHIIFSKYATTGDGILTSLKLMEVLLEKKLPLSRLGEEMKTYPQMLINIPVLDKGKALSDPSVVAAVSAAESRLNGRGRVLLRPSGTEPLVRVLVECLDERLCKETAREIAAAICALSP